MEGSLELSLKDAFVKALTEAVFANLNNEQFGAEQLSEEVGISRSQIHRKLKKINGKSITQFIREIRLEEARRLLLNEMGTASEIAYRVGFGSPTYFNKCFREHYGYTPGEAKKFKPDHEGELSTSEIHGKPSENRTGHNLKKKNRNFLQLNLRYVFYILISAVIIVIAAIYLFKPNNILYNSPSSVEKTIAVLPFENLSNDPDQEYFSDGMMVEIVNQLVQIKDLHVTSRASVMQYKETTKILPEIARELGVSTILSGNVRKEGDRVRIDVQLIDGITDVYIWAESFDRNLEEIFHIQNEVARQVASKLQINVQEEIKTRILTQPTENIEAYDLYLEAVWNYYSYKHDASKKAEILFEKVLEMDPEFAEAYAYLGDLKSNFHWASINPRASSSEEAVNVALPYYQKALKLDPDNIWAHKFLGEMYYYHTWNFEKALREYEMVVKMEPNYYSSGILEAFGRYEELYRLSELNVRLDPLNIEAWALRINCLIHNNENKKALEHLEMLVKKDLQSYYVAIAEAYLYLGKYEEAIEMVHNYFEDYPDFRPPRTITILAIANQFTKEGDKVDKYIDEIIQRVEKNPAGSPYFNISMIYAQTGNRDLAFIWLEKAYQNHEPEMVRLKDNPMLESLYDDFRYHKMLDKIGFPN